MVLPLLQFAVFDEFGKPADDRVQDYGRACARAAIAASRQPVAEPVAWIEACAPFLKEGETPAECIARNRADVDGCLSLLIAERRKAAALRDALEEARTGLCWYRATLVQQEASEQEASERDAKRWQWLREQEQLALHIDGARRVTYLAIGCDVFGAHPTLDIAADAAIAAQESPGGVPDAGQLRGAS
jgi:hypothetical protein